jgi:DNA-binding beta-propeller fold protein YncE
VLCKVLRAASCIEETLMIARLSMLLATLLLAGPVAAARTHPYEVSGSIAGPDGGWDLVSVDSAARRLFIARGTTVMVVDLRHPESVRTFGPVARGHAAIAVPGGRVLVTSGTENKARIFDVQSGRDLVDATVGENPDAAIWDPNLSAALVMNARGGTVSVVDPSTGAVVRTIPLAPGLELPAIGANGLLYVANEEASLIHVVDPATGAVHSPILLPGCEGPTGLGYDARARILIAACANGKAAVVDAVRGRLSQLLDIGRGPDSVIIDPVRRVAFIPCGRDGELDVIRLTRGAPLVVSQRLITEVGARTGAVDVASGAVYLPTARFGPAPAGGGRPQALPGSFHVLVVRPG